MKKYIKASWGSWVSSWDSWDKSTIDLYFDNETHTLPVYERSIGDTGYSAQICPEYIEKIDVFGWRVNLFFNGEFAKRLELFETSYDAKDFVDSELEEYYI